MTFSIRRSFCEEFESFLAALNGKIPSETTRGPQLDWCAFPSWSTRFITAFRDAEPPLENTEQLIEGIARFSSNRDRVRYLLNNSPMRMLMDGIVEQVMESIQPDELKKTRKCIFESKFYMRQGSKFLAEGKTKEAFECFNKGVARAPFPDNLAGQLCQTYLSMCLVKRSRFFQVTKKYQESWQDMTDAVEYMNDPRMKEELIKKKNQLMTEIVSADGNQSVKPDTIEIDMKFQAQDVVIKPENPNLHAAAECLELVWTEKKGRHMITNRSIEPNTNIVAEDPYAVWLQPTDYDSYCAHCLKPLGLRSFPCRQCTIALYCSSKCSEAAWSSYHSVECKFLPFLKYMSMGHLALKMLLVEGLDSAVETHLNPPEPCPPESKRKFKSTFKDIYTLMSTYTSFAPITLASFTTSAVFMALLTHSMDIVQERPVEILAELYLKMICAIGINSLSIYDDRAFDEQEQLTFYQGSGGKKIGIGVYATTSLFNHSCSCNCDRIFIGSKVVLNTRYAIPKGNEVTISYGPSIAQSYEARQEDIKNNYYFECKCAICVAEQRE